MLKEYDIIVIGGGHAGCEAANAAAKLGSSVLLITMNMNQFAQMSCNPSMGGVAKGQIVREIDALGGMSGIVTDNSMIQFRMLNRSKGPAMWSPRAQNDRELFSKTWRMILEKNLNVDFWQDSVIGIEVKNEKIYSVKTKLGLNIKCKALVLANGTFLNGIIHIGEVKLQGGRIGDFASEGLTASLINYGIKSERLKTGTPVRVDGRSVDFSKMEEQKGDEDPGKFSFLDTPRLEKQMSCYLAYTSEEVHDILRTGFDKSPMFQGRIQGRGPRYCPSIEDKIERFHEKTRHQLFIEPEGWDSIEYYVNGFSSSLPDYIQYAALKKISGFENVKIFRPGYAIEYDYFPPVQLKNNLESKIIENLFFAGQINGTTGYEEAAAQGLMAGINANHKINNKKDFILTRADAYIGVLIDDLITKGIDEPYRMFTSRAEYRVLLRQDNADIRLTKKGYDIGLASEERFGKTNTKYKKINEFILFLKTENITPVEINAFLENVGSKSIMQKTKIGNLILRPEVLLFDLIKQINSVANYVSLNKITEEEIEETEISIKYENYILKEKDVVDKLLKFEEIELYENFDYNKINSLSIEAREKLTRIKPRTIGQASRIGGVSPADISVLLVYLGR
jgi:tRNA uridine 5-carboxymethylaminomethyl modification enzyme